MTLRVAALPLALLLVLLSRTAAYPCSVAGIAAELRSDFVQASTIQQPVVRRLEIPQSYDLLPIVRARQAQLAFSPVGFTPDLSRAVVYVHFAAASAGNGFYAVLSRRSGTWTIDRVIPVWTVGR
ncbi:MAG TPA: hypothetical protein VES67_23715 [Vicinamibacterales bacterium]|nr:hypothetical protein [Vicinamibacterales bacterium]